MLYLGTGTTGGCDPPFGFGDLNPGPLQKHPGFLTTEPSPSPGLFLTTSYFSVQYPSNQDTDRMLNQGKERVPYKCREDNRPLVVHCGIASLLLCCAPFPSSPLTLQLC